MVPINCAKSAKNTLLQVFTSKRHEFTGHSLV